MTALLAKPHEIRAMLSGDEFCAARCKVHHSNIAKVNTEEAV
jgi:hypothetical protein